MSKSPYACLSPPFSPSRSLSASVSLSLRCVPLMLLNVSRVNIICSIPNTHFPHAPVQTNIPGLKATYGTDALHSRPTLRAPLMTRDTKVLTYCSSAISSQTGLPPVKTPGTVYPATAHPTETARHVYRATYQQRLPTTAPHDAPSDRFKPYKNAPEVR